MSPQVGYSQVSWGIWWKLRVHLLLLLQQNYYSSDTFWKTLIFTNASRNTFHLNVSLPLFDVTLKNVVSKEVK